MYIGVDTHKAQHVLVALDAQGRTLGARTCANTPEGWAQGLAWANTWEGRIWGIENSGSWGKGFTQFLLVLGEAVVHEVSPHRTAQYRCRARTQDKTDETDALAIARSLLAEGEGLSLGSQLYGEGNDTFSATVTDGDNGGSQNSSADSFALTTFQSGNIKLHPIATTALGGGNVAAHT